MIHRRTTGSNARLTSAFSLDRYAKGANFQMSGRAGEHWLSSWERVLGLAEQLVEATDSAEALDYDGDALADSHEMDSEGFEFEDYVYSRAVCALVRKISVLAERRNYAKISEYWKEFVRNLELSPLHVQAEVIDEFEEALEELEHVVGSRIYFDEPQDARDVAVGCLLVQASDELIRRAAVDPQLLRQISPRKFEELMAAIFSSFGYEVELTAMSRDGGADLIAVKKRRVTAPTRLLVECKRYVPPNKVGVGKVRELWGVKNSCSATQAVLATTSYFTRGARDFELNHVYELALKDFEAVAGWVKEADGNDLVLA